VRIWLLLFSSVAVGLMDLATDNRILDFQLVVAFATMLPLLFREYPGR